jgi:hypothetical protein
LNIAIVLNAGPKALVFLGLSGLKGRKNKGIGEELNKKKACNADLFEFVMNWN